MGPGTTRGMQWSRIYMIQRLCILRAKSWLFLKIVLLLTNRLQIEGRILDLCISHAPHFLDFADHCCVDVISCWCNRYWLKYKAITYNV
jgi:hypothetical protein